MSTSEFDPSLLGLDAWIGSLGGEVLCLLDPYTGKKLAQDVPAPAIERQDELANGVDYLRRNGAKIHIVPYYSRHDDRADLGVPDVFESQIRTSDFFGYESLHKEDDELHQAVARKVLLAIEEIGHPQTLE